MLLLAPYGRSAAKMRKMNLKYYYYHYYYYYYYYY